MEVNEQGTLLGLMENPSYLFQLLDKHRDDDMLLPLIPKHKDLLFNRNEDGKTLAQVALARNRLAVVIEILNAVQLPLSNLSLKMWEILIGKSKENMIENITHHKSKCGHTDIKVLEQLANDMIVELAENGSVEIICHLLLAGDCASGFIQGRKTHFNAFLNYPNRRRLGERISLDRTKPCNGNQILPECSSLPSDLQMFNSAMQLKNTRKGLN